jgi:hypothetical protein
MKKQAAEVKSINLYSPHDKQKLIHSACVLSDPSFFITVVAGRRGGKSMCAINQTLYWSLKDEKSITWYVCPTDGQCQNVINDVVKAVHNSGLVKKINNSKGDRIIEFNNGSVIHFKSALSADSLRGSLVNYMIVDEAAFIGNKLFDTVLMPSMAVGGKKCLIISTPRGTNWFHNYYTKGLVSKQNKFKSFKFTSYDNPAVDKTLIELFKSQVPEGVFDQEYLGEFVDSAAVFKYVSELCCLNKYEPKTGQHYVCGIDIGLLHDDTVVTILDTNGNMIYVDAFTGLQAPELRKRILSTLNKYKPVKTLIESNNQGLPLIHDLKREWHGIEEFMTTNKSKEEIVNKLVAAFSGKEIKCLNNEELIIQLNSFIFELTNTGKIRYCAAPGFHDDYVMSLAIAYSMCFDKFRHVGSAHKYVLGKDDVGNALVDRKVRPDLRPLINTQFRF